jgi:hypothetical protein
MASAAASLPERRRVARRGDGAAKVVQLGGGPAPPSISSCSAVAGGGVTLGMWAGSRDTGGGSGQSVVLVEGGEAGRGCESWVPWLGGCREP